MKVFAVALGAHCYCNKSANLFQHQLIYFSLSIFFSFLVFSLNSAIYVLLRNICSCCVTAPWWVIPQVRLILSKLSNTRIPKMFLRQILTVVSAYFPRGQNSHHSGQNYVSFFMLESSSSQSTSASLTPKSGNCCVNANFHRGQNSHHSGQN